MASYAESFGYTPTQFMGITIPQLAAYGRYVEKRNEESKKESKKSSSKSAGGASMSITDLANTFGTPETKAKLRKQGFEAAKKVKAEKAKA
jgi:L-ribulose-5-phosphate 3-epimerase UlaE